MHDPSRMPLFLFAALAFLMVCVVLAIATWIFVKSGEPGRTKLNGAAGCAVGFAVLGIAGLMALCTAAAMALSGGREIAREVHRNGGIHWDSDSEDAREREPAQRSESSESREHEEPTEPREPREHEHDGGLDVVFTLGDAGSIGTIMERVRDLAPGGLASALDSSSVDGVEHSRLEIHFDVGDDARDALRARIEATWPDGKLPDGGTLKIVSGG